MKRIVIKIGSRTLTDAQGNLNQEVILATAKNISLLQKQGISVVVVTSGAVNAGHSIVSLDDFNIEKEAIDYSEAILKEQILASIGQPKVIHSWVEALEKHGTHCAQILTTRSDFANRKNYLSIRSVVVNLLRLNVVPIFNENDVLSPERLDFTDNDQQACMIAAMLAADKLILLSDIEGVYDGSPKDASSKVIPTIEDPMELVGSVDTFSGGGKGGMKSKLMAADLAMTLGIDTYIVNGRVPDNLFKIMDGTPVGTHFPAKKSMGKVKPIKSWLTSAASGEGKIIVSTYLADMLRKKHVASILFSGIEKIEGEFKEGDAVDICNDTNKLLGRGIVRFGSENLERKLHEYKKMPNEERINLKTNAIIAVHYDYLVFL